MRKKLIRLTVLAITIGGSLLGIGTTPAFAADARPDVVICETGYTTVLSNQKAVDKAFSDKTWTSGISNGDVTVTAQRQASLTASSTISANTDVSVNVAVAAAKTQYGISATISMTETEWFMVSGKITKGYYGHLKFVSFGYSFTWKYEYTSSNCQTKVVSTGTVKVVESDNIGYRYWEPRPRTASTLTCKPGRGANGVRGAVRITMRNRCAITTAWTSTQVVKPRGAGRKGARRGAATGPPPGLIPPRGPGR